MNKRLAIIILVILLTSIACFFIFQKPTVEELYNPEITSNVEKTPDETTEIIDNGEIVEESFSLFNGSNEVTLTPEQIEKQKMLLVEYEEKLATSLENIYAIEKEKTGESPNVHNTDIVNSIKEALIADSFKITDTSVEDKIILNITFITRINVEELTQEQHNDIFQNFTKTIAQFSTNLYHITNMNNEINFYINEKLTHQSVTYLKK